MNDNTQPFTPGGAPAARAPVEQLKAYSAHIETADVTDTHGSRGGGGNGIADVHVLEEVRTEGDSEGALNETLWHEINAILAEHSAFERGERDSPFPTEVPDFRNPVWKRD